MKQKKLYIYFLLFSISLLLISDVPSAKADSSKIMIDLIYDLNFFTTPLIYEIGSDLFESDMCDFPTTLMAVNTSSDTGTIIELTLDDSDVDIQKKGHYKIDLHLSYDTDNYVLADCYQEHYTIPVCVADTSEFEVFQTYTSTDCITLSFIYPFTNYHTITYSFFESKELLSFDELSCSNWETKDSSEQIKVYPDAIQFPSSQFKENIYYYYKFENEGQISNIICIQKQSESIISTTIGGDRDGGDFESNPSEDILQIIPKTPTPTRLPIATPTHTPAATPTKIPLLLPSVKPAPPSSSPSEASASPAPVSNHIAYFENLGTLMETPLPIQIKNATETYAVNQSTSIPDKGTVIGITSSQKYTNNTSRSTISISSLLNQAQPFLTSTIHAAAKSSQPNSGIGEPSAPVTEEFSRDRTSITGERLRIMAESNPDFISFEHNGAVLSIPTKYLLSLNLSDSEVLIISIRKTSKNTFDISISNAGQPLTTIPDSKLTDKEQNSSIKINKTGVYTFTSSSTDHTSGPLKVYRILPTFFTVLVLTCTIFYYYHQKKGKKEHEN